MNLHLWWQRGPPLRSSLFRRCLARSGTDAWMSHARLWKETGTNTVLKYNPTVTPNLSSSISSTLHCADIVFKVCGAVDTPTVRRSEQHWFPDWSSQSRSWQHWKYNRVCTWIRHVMLSLPFSKPDLIGSRTTLQLRQRCQSLHRIQE